MSETNVPIHRTEQSKNPGLFVHRPSHVLLAMGVPPELANATVRFSLGRSTTQAEIDATIAVVGRIMARTQTEIA